MMTLLAVVLSMLMLQVSHIQAFLSPLLPSNIWCPLSTSSSVRYPSSLFLQSWAPVNLAEVTAWLFPANETVFAESSKLCADLAIGHPSEVIGFWQMYNGVTNCDLNVDRVDQFILRADGQAVGGPVITSYRNAWSDPTGLRGRGGNWEVIKDKEGNSMLQMEMVVHRQNGENGGENKQLLVFDGSIYMVNEYDMGEGKLVFKPRAYGVVKEKWIVNGEEAMRSIGHFAMLKVD